VNAFTTALLEKAAEEEAGIYRPYYQGLRGLEVEYRKVFENQLALFQDNEEPLEYALANLMYSAHTAHYYPLAPPFCRKDMLQAAQAVLSVPTGHACLVSLIVTNFPQAMFSAEYLYFKNRTALRFFDLPEKERPPVLHGHDKKDWAIPSERVEALRDLALEIWQKEQSSDSEA